MSLDKLSIQHDVALIQDALNPFLKRMSLFGSVLTKQISEIHDIDLACFIDGVPLSEAARMVLNLKLSRFVRITKINGYVKHLSQEICHSAYYHITILDGRNPNPAFMLRNEKTLLDLPLLIVNSETRKMSGNEIGLYQCA